MLPDKNKAKLLNEGRHVASRFFNYGGFPRISNINEEEIRSDISPEHRKWYEKLQKLQKELGDAKKSKDEKAIEHAVDAIREHRKDTPKMAEPHSHRSATYHHNTRIDSSREGT